MTKRRAVRGGFVAVGRERAEEEGVEGEERVEGDEVEGEGVEEAVEAVFASSAPPPAPPPPAPPPSLLIFLSINARLLCHCLRRGKRRAVPDATLGTETKTSAWFEAGIARHEEETSPQHSVGAPAEATVPIIPGLAAR